MTPWRLSHRFDPQALPLADRHYNRQKPGTPQFVPPGRNIVLLTHSLDALWVSSFPLPEFTQHQWAGAWICSLFRNESPALSSQLITDAVAITHHFWGPPPPLGFVTFVNPSAVRHKRDPGRCYRKAGFRPVGYTQKRHYLALQLTPNLFPPPLEPPGAQRSLFQWVQKVQ